MNKKQTYSTPETELFVVRFEGNLLASGSGTITNVEEEDYDEL